MSKLIHLIFLISLFLIFLLPPTDPDLGWQLRCGELFWTEQSFCEDNQFSVLLEDYSWPNHAWGYQATIYPIYQAFDGWGLTVLNALLMTAAFGFLFAAYRCSSAIYCALAILATIYFGWGVFSFGIRSQLVGFFFFNLTLYLLTKVEGKPKLAFLLPLVVLVWTNTHGSVILGLILILSYLTFRVIREMQGSRAERGVLISYAIASLIKDGTFLKHKPPPLLVSSLLAVGATLINPFGFRIYEEMWRHFSGPIDLSKLIAEWVPPQPHIQQIVLISGGAVVFIYMVYHAFVETRLIASLPHVLLIPFFAFFALKARRNVPFHFVVLSYSLLNSLKTKISPLRNQLAGLLSVGVLLYGLIIQLPNAIEQDHCRGNPCAAIEFLKEQGPPNGEASNIFNRYEWGGFLIWQLPEYKIFVDGRMPAWRDATRSLGEGWADKSPYTIYLHTLQTRQAGGQARPGWQETLDQYDISWILISPNTFMDLKLRPNPENFGWQELFRNKTSVVYKKLPE